MRVSPQQLRDWLLLFPRHPIAWLLAAGLLVVILANRAPRPTNPGGETPASSRDARPALSRAERARQYAWLSKKSLANYQPLLQRIASPDGFARVDAPSGSYAEWLRHLPCLPEIAPVFDGRGKIIRPADDPAVAAVIDLHPTNRNLLGAANMAVRLRAEYLWTAGRMADSRFTFTSGDPFDWKRFADGERPTVHGRNVAWKSEAPPSNNRGTFTAFVETLMRFSSSINLERDTRPADGDVQPGDLFVIVGRPGHAVIVLDVAVDANGRRRALLGEGLTPPQSFHVLLAADGSPWFLLDRATALNVPTWGTLTWRHWRRWPD